MTTNEKTRCDICGKFIDINSPNITSVLYSEDTDYSSESIGIVHVACQEKENEELKPTNYDENISERSRWELLLKEASDRACSTVYWNNGK